MKLARVCAIFALGCASCSFVGERLPKGPATEGHATRARRRCPNNDIAYPIADLFSTVASTSWLFYADRKLKEAATPNADGTSPDQSNNGTYRTLRSASYVAIPLFFASTVWGLYAESVCSNEPDRRFARPNRPTLTRAGFPGSVFGFDYQMRPEQAAALCAAKGQEWTFEGSTGLCQSRVASVVVPDLRLEFRLGTPSEIIVVYRSPANGINQNFAELYATTKKNFGPPQVEPKRVSAACAQSLADCLANGEHPSGPVWQWADGSIELAPIWQGDHALLELHYTREEPQTQ